MTDFDKEFTSPEAPSPFEARYPEYDGLGAVALGQEMEKVKAEIDAEDEILGAMKARYEHLTAFRIPRAIEAEGLKNFRLASGRGVTVEARLFVSVPAENKEALYAFLRDSGNGGMITETINANTLKSAVRKALADGEDFPFEILKLTTVPTAKFFK